MGYPSYCAVIRTLGKAGAKFETEINSLLAQTHRPERILVYIPDGYDIPDIAANGEITYIRSPKGMVTQRSLPFDEVTTRYILFVDDDVYFPQDAVAKLFDALLLNGADCISPSVLPTYDWSLHVKLGQMFYGIHPHFGKNWGLKVKRNGAFTYNLHPEPVMRSQTNPGPCALCSMEVYKAIHFEDERWMDSLGYPLGEDQLFYNKMHVVGYKVLTHYATGAVHLDGGTGGGKTHTAATLVKKSAVGYLVWLRSCYSLASSPFERLRCCVSFYMTQMSAWAGDLIIGVLMRRPVGLLSRFKGIKEGKKIAKSELFVTLPRYDAYKR